jgi:hypothetical protein
LKLPENNTKLSTRNLCQKDSRMDRTEYVQYRLYFPVLKFMPFSLLYETQNPYSMALISGLYFASIFVLAPLVVRLAQSVQYDLL